MGQRAAQVLPETGSELTRKSTGLLESKLELCGGAGEPEGLQFRGHARRVLAEQYEVAGVGDEDEPVFAPIFADLFTGCRQPGVIGDGLDFDHAALRRLALARLAPLNLTRGIETEVRMARALLCKLADAEYFGLEHASNGVEQVGQRRVVGALAGGAAGRSDPAQIGKILLYRRCQLRCVHPIVQGLIGSTPLPAMPCTSLVATDASRQRAMAAM